MKTIYKGIILALLVSVVASTSAGLALRPSVFYVFFDDGFVTDCDDAGVTDFYLGYLDNGTRTLALIEENGTGITGAESIDSFAVRRDKIYEPENITIVRSTQNDINVTEEFTELVTHEYNETFSENFSTTVSHDFEANFSAAVRAYMNYSYAENFSHHVVEEYNNSGEMDSRVYPISKMLRYGPSNGTGTNTSKLYHWLDMRYAKPAIGTGNLTRVSLTTSVGSTYYKNGTSGYLTMQDTSTSQKVYLNMLNSSRYIVISNRSEALKFEIKWRLRNSGGTYAGAYCYAQEFSTVSGGSAIRGTDVSTRSGNFGWTVDSKTIYPSASTNFFEFVVIPANAWQNDATGLLDIEYIKVYRTRYSYNANVTTNINLAAYPEYSNSSWNFAGIGISGEILAGYNSSNRFDYDWDVSTGSGTTQIAPQYRTNVTIFENRSEFYIGINGAKTTRLTPKGLWNWTSSTNIESTESHFVNWIPDPSGQYLSVMADFNPVSSAGSVIIFLWAYAVFYEANWSVSYTVDEWINHTADIEFDLEGNNNYTYYSLDENSTMREEISFVIENMTNDYIEEHFSETVGHVFEVTAYDYFEQNVSYTFRYEDVVNTTTNIFINYTSEETLEYTRFVVNTTVTTVTRTLTSEERIEVSEIMTVIHFHEFRIYSLETPIMITSPSWYAYTKIDLVGFDDTVGILSYGVSKISIFEMRDELEGWNGG